MVICEKCYTKMKLKKNAVSVRFNEDGCHTYSGDRYRCEECGNTTIITAEVPFDVEHPTYTENDVWMDLKCWQHVQKQYPTLDVISLMVDTGCKYCVNRDSKFSSLHGTFHYCNKHSSVIPDLVDNEFQAPSSPCDHWTLSEVNAFHNDIIDSDGTCIQSEYLNKKEDE